MPSPLFRTVAATLAVTAALGAGVAALLVAGGYPEVAADRAHTQPVYSVMELALRQSVRRRAATVAEPALDAPALQQRGAACFRAHCLACHGAPGVAPDPAGLAMQPLPGPLVDAAARWRPRELYWITRHGVRMTGMPAWGMRLPDADLWAVVALLQRLPQLSPDAWSELHAQTRDTACPAGPQDDAPGAALASAGADAAERGRDALARHACHGCHLIPGVVGSQRHVGPPLAGWGRRTLIKGRLPNTPQNLAAWIRDPQALAPGSAMPATGVGAADAQAMAAYLLTLR